MVYDLHFGCKGTTKKRDTQEKKKKNHRSPAWDVTIRIADAKKSNEVFPNKDHKIAKKTKKMQNYLVMSEKSSNFAGYFAERPD